METQCGPNQSDWGEKTDLKVHDGHKGFSDVTNVWPEHSCGQSVTEQPSEQNVNQPIADL